MGNNKDIYCYTNREMVNFEREYQPLALRTKIFVMNHFSYMPDQISGKMKKKPQLSGQNLTFFSALPFQNIRTYSKSFTWTNVICYRLGIAKILLKHLHPFWSNLEKTWGGKLHPLVFNPFRHGGGGMMAPNIFDHCAQTLRRRKLRLADF